MPACGSLSSRLIIVRGPSGAGKSTLARAIRDARPRGVAIVGQDQLRREILHAADLPGNPAIGLIGLTARHALDSGLHVVVEGILDAGRYGPMLTALAADHRGVTRAFRYVLPFGETLRRHATKPGTTFGETEMRQWWIGDDPVADLAEQVIGPGLSTDDALDLTLRAAGWR